MHTSGFSTLQHAANQSSLIFVRVFFLGGGVTAFTSNALFFPFSTKKPPTWWGLGWANWKSATDSLYVPDCWPFGRGGGTACRYDAWRNIIRAGVLIYIVSTAVSVSVYKIWPHHCAEGPHAGFPQSTEKAKVSMVTLKCPWIPELSWQPVGGLARPGWREKGSGCELRWAVAPVPKSEEQTDEEEHSPL